MISDLCMGFKLEHLPFVSTLVCAVSGDLHGIGRHRDTECLEDLESFGIGGICDGGAAVGDLCNVAFGSGPAWEVRRAEHEVCEEDEEEVTFHVYCRLCNASSSALIWTIRLLGLFAAAFNLLLGQDNNTSCEHLYRTSKNGKQPVAIPRFRDGKSEEKTLVRAFISDITQIINDCSLAVLIITPRMFAAASSLTTTHGRIFYQTGGFNTTKTIPRRWRYSRLAHCMRLVAHSFRNARLHLLFWCIRRYVICLFSATVRFMVSDYYTRIFLSSHDPSSIAWMGSFQLALPFAIGPFAGKAFDAGHSRLIMSIGAFLYLFSLFMLSLAKQNQYYQVFLSQGLGMGIGAGLLFTPSTAVIGIHFTRRRGLAYGAALTGISIGAVVFPIALNRLIPLVGFADAVRATAYIATACLVLGVALVQPPSRTSSQKQPVHTSTFFRDPPYLWFLLGNFVCLLSVYFPVFYLQLFAVKHNIGDTLAFYSLAILNGSGIIGRIGGTWLADRYGVWNVQVPTTLATAVTIWAVIGINNSAALVIVSCLYGILSGGWLAISVSGLVSLSTSANEVGARVGVANAFMSISLVLSGPIQGALLTSDFYWIRPIVFSGTLMTVSTCFYAMTRYYVAVQKGSTWI